MTLLITAPYRQVNFLYNFNVNLLANKFAHVLNTLAGKHAGTWFYNFYDENRSSNRRSNILNLMLLGVKDRLPRDLFFLFKRFIFFI